MGLGSSKESSFTKIENYLYLGNAETANDGTLLTKLAIRKVLSVRGVPVCEDNKVSGIEYLHIPIDDTLNDDILTHFPTAHRFIVDGQNNKLTVYVHCRLGVSRSATIVISYLMAKYRIHYDEALRKVHKLRHQVRPNSSFLYQLKLFDEMNFSFNALNPSFRLFLLKRWIFVMKNKIILDVEQKDMTILEKFFSHLSLSEQAEGAPLLCAKCKTVLLRDINIVRDLSQDRPRNQCQYLVTEPKGWMLPNVSTKSMGSIQCPNCRTTVGDFHWKRPVGTLCSCILHAKMPFQVFRFVVNSLKRE